MSTKQCEKTGDLQKKQRYRIRFKPLKLKVRGNICETAKRLKTNINVNFKHLKTSKTVKIDKKAPCKVVIMTLQGADVKEWKRVYWKVNIKKPLQFQKLQGFFYVYSMAATAAMSSSSNRYVIKSTTSEA